jgi:hypothetical protein
VAGALRSSSESSEARWVAPNEIDRLNIHPSMRLRIEHGLSKQDGPYIG